MCDGLTCAFCTLFAVGRCGDCGEPVCGDCGRRYGVAFLCKRCRDGREHAKAQAEADRLQIAAEAREAKARADAEAGARDLEARAEWLRQLARALASAGVKTNHGKGWKVSERTKSSQWVDRTNGVQYDFSSPSFTMDIRSQVALTRGGMLIAEVQTKRAGVRTWQPAKIVDATKTTSFNNVRDYVQKSYRVQFPTFAEFSKTL